MPKPKSTPSLTKKKTASPKKETSKASVEKAEKPVSGSKETKKTVEKAPAKVAKTSVKESGKASTKTTAQAKDTKKSTAKTATVKASPKSEAVKATPAKAVKSKTAKPKVILPAESVKVTVLKELREQLSQAGLIGMGRPPRVVVAFSGGSDSTALLHALAQLRDTEGLEALAVYYHHNWRGTPAPELPRVHKNCQRLRIPLVFAPPHPDEEKSEVSARHFRYERLIDVATQFKAEAVLTAHHQDDQIETILFRIFRGTGPDGLEGIQRALFFKKQGEDRPSHIPILRPFLGLSERVLSAYTESNELLFFKDPSNTNTRYARNAIRHTLLPVIKAQFPTYEKAVLKLSHLVEGDVSILDHITQTQWDALELKGASPSVFQFGAKRSTTLFCQLNVPYQRRLVRHLLQQFNIESDFEDTQRLIGFLTQDLHTLHLHKKDKHGVLKKPKASVKMSLGTTREGDLRFLLRSNSAFWVEVHPRRDEAYRHLIAQSVAVPLGGGVVTLPWDAGQALRVEPFPKRAGMFDVRKLTSAKSKDILVNLSDYAGQGVVLRTRQAGDWLKPLGMKGKRMKLKAFFIAQRIPQELRAEWPVVACGDEVLWVPGIGVSEALRVTMKVPPTHTWMLGDTEEVTQLRTLRFLEDPTTSIAEQEEAALEAGLEDVLDESLEEGLVDTLDDDNDGFDEVNHIKSVERLMLEHDLDPDEIDVIDLEEVLELDDDEIEGVES
ncbi:MAG: tRNA lysidine(34) synthetase TilS [Vampirovibrionales bacterium]